ncbi:BrxA family protein [Dietzia maris]|uniref:BrxA family protein n=1 Tax=Dietzia maris TaxID=37915 RepID=UPI00344EABB1
MPVQKGILAFPHRARSSSHRWIQAKAMWHDELGAVTDLSYKKLRQVLFKMMVEAGLLTTKGAIEPALLSARVVDCLSQRTPSDIRFFPTREP